MRILDLFAGLGGASAAQRKRGWDVVTVDADPACGCTHTADLTAWEYPGPWPVDLVWASPPCQEFSRWGMPWLRKKNPPAPSLDLVRAAMRIIREVEPIWWVVENVRGAVRWFRPILGAPRASYHGVFLWGRFPDLGRVATDPHKERLSGKQVAERSRIPLAISEAVAEACESATLATLFDQAERQGVA